MIIPSPLHNLIFFPNRLDKLYPGPGGISNYIHPCLTPAATASVENSNSPGSTLSLESSRLRFAALISFLKLDWEGPKKIDLKG